MAADSVFTHMVHRIGCLRGISTLTGFALAVEIGDRYRFTGNTIGSFVGLVPSEYSSGSSRVQGSITKTGNITGPSTLAPLGISIPVIASFGLVTGQVDSIRRRHSVNASVAVLR